MHLIEGGDKDSQCSTHDWWDQLNSGLVAWSNKRFRYLWAGQLRSREVNPRTRQAQKQYRRVATHPSVTNGANTKILHNILQSQSIQYIFRRTWKQASHLPLFWCTYFQVVRKIQRKKWMWACVFVSEWPTQALELSWNNARLFSFTAMATW